MLPKRGAERRVTMDVVLIAEDNVEYRRLMAIHLRRAGYRVLEASDGVEALALAAHDKPQLVILDIMMPRLDGFETTREVRALLPGVPVLIVTARESFSDMREGFRRGADDYMTKPINMEEMLLRVAALIRRAGVEGGSCAGRALRAIGRYPDPDVDRRIARIAPQGI